MPDELKIRNTARRPTFDGTETISWANVNRTFRAFARAAGASDADNVEDLTSSQKRRISAHTLLGDAGADTFSDLVFFPVVNPGTGKLNAGALRAVLSGRGAAADIPATALDSARAVAERLLDNNFRDESSLGGLATKFQSFMVSVDSNKK